MGLPRLAKSDIGMEEAFLSSLPSALPDRPGAQWLKPREALRSDFGLMKLSRSLYSTGTIHCGHV